MKNVCGLEVKLQVAGVALEEYKADKGDSSDVYTGPVSNMTRYVEAVSGSTFGIHIFAPLSIVPKIGDTAVCTIYLDGAIATSRLCDSLSFNHVPYSMLLHGIDSQTPHGRTLQRFTFAQLETNDDPLPANLKPEDFKDLGTVTVKCTWGRRISEPVRSDAPSFQSAAGTAISEKCLKGRAISNQAR